MALDLKKFGALIRQIRQQQNLTLQEVHAATNLSAITLAKVEKGNPARLSTIEKLSAVYKVDLMYYLHSFRMEDDLFSKDLHNALRDQLLINDINAAAQTLTEAVEAVKKLYDEAFEDLSYIKTLDEIKGQLKLLTTLDNNLISKSETILATMKGSKGSLWDNDTRFDFELYLMLFIAVQYAAEGNPAKAAEHHQAVYSYIEAIQIPTTYQSDLKMLALLNLCHFKLMDNKPGETLELIDKVFADSDRLTSNRLHNELLLRKGIALYKLGDPNYKALCTTVLLNETSSGIMKAYRYMTDKHDIQVEEFFDISQALKRDTSNWNLL